MNDVLQIFNVSNKKEEKIGENKEIAKDMLQKIVLQD